MPFPEPATLLETCYPNQRHRFFAPMTIGATPEAADRGVELVLSGAKITTSSPLWDYPDGRLPFVGALSLLLDAKGAPHAIVETRRVEIVRFGDVGAGFAQAYGEGDGTLAWFREEIGAWYRRSAERAGERFADDTQVICEWFAVVRRL